MKMFPYETMNPLEDLKRNYAICKDAIRMRLSEFAAVPPSKYFYELIYCLLTPQSSAVHADRVVAQLRITGFHIQEIDPAPFLRVKENYIRFHHTKARYLVLLKSQFPIIADKLSKPVPASELRDWLDENVLGLGLKEASHFLRNIGKNDGLTILDRHILRTLKRLKVIREIPDSLSRKKYLHIEEQFIKFSTRVGIPVDELDLLFWSTETGEIRK
jgi:N-glycosylase/DNA lyase